jgi:type II secretory pathway pseudopilin PulG
VVFTDLAKHLEVVAQSRVDLNSRGMSLVETMIVLGIVSTMGLAMATMMNNSAKMQQSLRITAEINDAANSIQLILQSSDRCAKAFRLSSSQNAQKLHEPVKIFEPESGTILFDQGTDKGGWKVSTIKFRPLTEPRGEGTTPLPAMPSGGVVNLWFKTEKTDSTFFGPKDIWRNFAVSVKTDASGKMLACSTQNQLHRKIVVGEGRLFRFDPGVAGSVYNNSSNILDFNNGLFNSKINDPSGLVGGGYRQSPSASVECDPGYIIDGCKICTAAVTDPCVTLVDSQSISTGGSSFTAIRDLPHSLMWISSIDDQAGRCTLTHRMEFWGPLIDLGGLPTGAYKAALSGTFARPIALCIKQ